MLRNPIENDEDSMKTGLDNLCCHMGIRPSVRHWAALKVLLTPCGRCAAELIALGRVALVAQACSGSVA
jgi:hypothetical protein